MHYQIAKRVLDVSFSILSLIAFFPLLLLVAIIIKLNDGGSIFADIPDMLGKDGKPFFMYKFRSMEQYAHTKMKNGEYGKKEKQAWAKQIKLPTKNDPRITWIGKIIRGCDFDEVPQLINVLKGDMSLVGPRPHFVDELDFYSKEHPTLKKYMKDILSVKPGVTGLWQVSGRNLNTIEKRYQLDAKYAKSVSFNEDMKIFLKTFIVLLSREGAV